MTEKLLKAKKKKRVKKHGFMSKMKTASGRKTIKARRNKGRKRLAVARKK
jgi:large subunit ribosomal protein L34